MNLLLAATVAVLFGTGAYLMLKRDLIRVVAGVILLSNAVNLFIMSIGLSRGRAPIHPLPADGRVSDPLVQAMTLTAIVISFGISALLLALVYRVYAVYAADRSPGEAAEAAGAADARSGDSAAGGEEPVPATRLDGVGLEPVRRGE